MSRKNLRLSGCVLVIGLCMASGGMRGAAGELPHRSPVENLENSEAVIETSLGTIVIELFPKDAPRHVEYFVNQIKAGAYDGTTFFRLVKYGLIQGGDPLAKTQPAKGRAQIGTGGLNAGIPDEINKNKHIPGAVSAVLQAEKAGSTDVKPGSSGSQFFIVLNAGSAQASLDSKFTVFGRVLEGMDIAMKISETPVNDLKIANDRIEIKKISLREKTSTVEQMKIMSVVIETSLGDLKLQLMPDAAPDAARSFLRYARSGFYDGTTFFRVSQKYFLEAGNAAEWPQDSPNRKRTHSIWPVAAEKSDTKQVRGTVSLRRVDDSTLQFFFILAQDNPALDGKHVPFARVADGLDVLDKIAGAEVEGDKPKQRVEIKKVTVQ